jgi:hypothetical protein
VGIAPRSRPCRLEGAGVSATVGSVRSQGKCFMCTPQAAFALIALAALQLDTGV